MSEPEKQIQTAFAENGKLYFLDTSGNLFSVFREAVNFKIIEAPVKRWAFKGSKMPFDVWRSVMGFLRWSQKAHESEAMLIFFYNKENGSWGAACFPQKTMGMSVKLDTEDPEYAAVRAEFGKGWAQFGSIHHHCSSAAFQSGTDKDDEDKKDGLHITIGNIDEAEASFHARFVYKGTTHEAGLQEWIEPPDFFKELPKSLQTNDNLNKILCSVEGAEPPETWQKRVRKHTPTFQTACFSYTGRSSYDYWADQRNSPEDITIEDVTVVMDYMEQFNVHPSKLVSSVTEKRALVKFAQQQAKINLGHEKIDLVIKYYLVDNEPVGSDQFKT